MKINWWLFSWWHPRWTQEWKPLNSFFFQWKPTNLDTFCLMKSSPLLLRSFHTVSSFSLISLISDRLVISDIRSSQIEVWDRLICAMVTWISGKGSLPDTLMGCYYLHHLSAPLVLLERNLVFFKAIMRLSLLIHRCMFKARIFDVGIISSSLQALSLSLLSNPSLKIFGFD